MTPSYPLMMPSNMIYSYCQLHPFKTLFGVDTYIFIVVVFFFRGRRLFLIYFLSNLTKSSIQRWFPINLNTMVNNKKYYVFVVFASCLCCKLFIMGFLRGALIAVQKEKFEKHFLCGPAQTRQQKITVVCLFTRPLLPFTNTKPVLYIQEQVSQLQQSV